MTRPDPNRATEPEWRGTVSVREDPELAQWVTGHLPSPAAPRSVSVTDLLGPRPAFWRATAPTPPSSPERDARLEGGRRVHREVGALFAASGELEVRVRRNGVHGRIDVLADRPIEVKTSSSPLPSEELARSRPDHVDQLAMYCALLDRDEGRLIYLHSRDARADRAAVYDLRFRSLPDVQREMATRAERLRSAVRDGRSSGLPRCAWFGRGCEWQAAGTCDCTGGEVAAEPLSADRIDTLADRGDLAGPLEAALAALPVPSASPVVELFRDLQYPRRAFFRRVLPAPTNPPGPPTRPTEFDLYRRLNEAVESGPVGEVARLATLSEEPDEEVGGFRGEPYLVRTSRAKARVPATDWLTRSPQYALDLGFRCVATGTRRGRIIVGYEHAVRESERVQVLEVTIDSPTVFSRLWRYRSALLGTALGAHDPDPLPACPGWMYSGCDYRDVCGCGTPSGRPQWKMTVDAVRKNPSVS
ncbi:MAG: PD-(D/E)XK nuclease family protein [Thermoplasmata archaeon]